MKRIALATCVATLLALVLTTGSSLTGAGAQKSVSRYRPLDESGQFVSRRVLVKFRSGIMPDHARNIIAALGARDADEIPNIGVHILDLPYQASENAFVKAFEARAEVEFAELDKMVQPADVTPNDPWYPSEWHLAKISAPSAWATTVGSGNVTVAILDTGVDDNHPDLAANMVTGWNFYDNNSNTNDVVGHGTAVAGTVSAASNNGQGVAAVAWGCRLMPIRISDLNGTATYSAAATGLTWAADHGAKVANISYIMTDSSAVTSAAKYFQSMGGVVTISAGNYTTFDSSADNPYVLTVSGITGSDLIWANSNTGNNVDLCAPYYVYTTIRGGGYSGVSGTSVSAPIVAGVAALVLSANPNLSGTKVQDILKQSADDLGPAGWDPSYGSGRVNAARAVGLAGGSPADVSPPSVSFSAPLDGASVSGNVTIAIAASDNVGVFSVTLNVDGGLLGTDNTSPYGFLWDTRALSTGSHTLSATVSDAAGNLNTTSIVVTLNNALDTAAPSVIISSPTDGTKAPSNLSIKVSAADNVGVVKVELYVDGMLQAASTSAPFTTKWNTTKASKGSHTLQCKAYDSAGNVGVSQQVTVYK